LPPEAASPTVARYAGFVAKYMGDAALIYFGYSKAHEQVPSGRPGPDSPSSTRSGGSRRRTVKPNFAHF
jgi:class 3 adenylate cyclase